MDAFYDIQSAQEALNNIASARTAGKASAVQLSTYAKSLNEELSTVTTNIPKGVRLIEQREGLADCQEVVLRVQGALCSVQLPPLRANLPLPDKGDARYMKQSIRLTGLGGEHFKGAIEGLVNIATLMGENLERGEIESWTPARFRCWQALEVSNRYFVHQNSEGDMVSEPLSTEVDPDGVLAALAGDEWVHTEDNVVSYFRLITNNEGKPKYASIKPGEFKTGDLVEAQLSAIAVKRRIRGDVYSMKLVLRALTMLEDGYCRAARATRMQQAARTPTTPARIMKRTVGYMDDDEEGDGDVPTSKMKKLTVNGAVMTAGDHQSSMEIER